MICSHAGEIEHDGVFEYRIVSTDGVGYPSPMRNRLRAHRRARSLDETRPARAPHYVERRSIGDWEFDPSVIETYAETRERFPL